MDDQCFASQRRSSWESSRRNSFYCITSL